MSSGAAWIECQRIRAEDFTVACGKSVDFPGYSGQLLPIWRAQSVCIRENRGKSASADRLTGAPAAEAGH